jgi:hypothetical protein
VKNLVWSGSLPPALLHQTGEIETASAHVSHRGVQ